MQPEFYVNFWKEKKKKIPPHPKLPKKQKNKTQTNKKQSPKTSFCSYFFRFFLGGGGANSTSAAILNKTFDKNRYTQFDN